jgi:uncharacterized protein (DUF58 family)
MLTSRGWWFVCWSAAALLLGVLFNVVLLVVLGLTLFIWFLCEWLLFSYRVQSIAGRLQIEREVRDEHGPVESMWAGQSLDVRVELRTSSALPVPYAAVGDLVPFDVEFVSGDAEIDGLLAAEAPRIISYRIRCRAAGQVRFEGVSVRLADLQGFFYRKTFVSDPVVYRVLPVLIEPDKTGATRKRHNILPPPGVHRLRRAGSGSELLDLRDYMPGDPPKTIAWKVSARRDKLITKEFESEVPVRCTLLLDTSNTVRLGPPGRNALSRLVEIAAVIAQANAGNRDLTGLSLFDDKATKISSPGRTPRHLASVINQLAEVANLAPAVSGASVEELLPVAYAFAEEVFPQLLHPALNHVPMRIPWFWKVPAYPKRRFRLGAYVFRFFLLILSLIPFAVMVFWITVGVQQLHRLLPRVVDRPPSTLFWLAIGLSGGVYFLGVYLFLRILPAFVSARIRRMVQWRKRLSALLALRYGLGPGGVGLLMEDDERFSLQVQRFLAEHHVPFPISLYDAQGRYLFASPEKVDVLAKTLLHAVAKGHDNELFVILADLLELTDRLDPLLRAMRVALARHHQVVVICPWPPGVRPPDADPRKPSRPRRGELGLGRDADILLLLQHMTEQRLHKAYRQLRHAFSRLGVTVICAESKQSAQLILDRMDRLRVAGIRR